MAKTDKARVNAGEVENGADIARKVSRYARIIEAVFQRYWKKGKTEFSFERDELIQVCQELSIDVPKNLGDIIYTFRYRKNLPKSILATQPFDRGWLILGDGDARYRFRLNKLTHIRPSVLIVEARNTSYPFKRRAERTYSERSKRFRT
ncbi:MAG: hypothetical protein M3N41_11750 [Acidobacteriota bacterium]|nr:hypothetical protein [Acidobacteriota bacterium]